jgi:hypothetical protein
VLRAKKAYPVYVDEMIELQSRVHLSGDARAVDPAGARRVLARHGHPTRADCRLGVMAVLLKESTSFRDRVVSFRSDAARFLAGVITFVPAAGPRLPARSGSRALSRPATQPNSARGAQS